MVRLIYKDRVMENSQIPAEVKDIVSENSILVLDNSTVTSVPESPPAKPKWINSFSY